MPDIMILPQLAAFFGVSIDELLGYEPQLSGEQIAKLHGDMKKAFVTKSFDDAMAQCRALVKKYYSCYPFLFTVCLIYLNHYNMAPDRNTASEVLGELNAIAEHIINDSNDIKLCNDTIAIKAIVDLLAGRPDKVVEVLEGRNGNEYMYAGNRTTLIQAYQQLGDLEMANKTAQVSMYTCVISLINIAVLYLLSNMGNKETCYETIRRTQDIIDAYKVDILNPNTAANFHYQSAVALAVNEDTEQAVLMLERYAKDINQLMNVDRLEFHGDGFFTKIEEWYKSINLEMGAPRDASLVWESAASALSTPAFKILENDKRFASLKRKIEGGKKHGTD